VVVVVVGVVGSVLGVVAVVGGVPVHAAPLTAKSVGVVLVPL
jgi:hypothetical protein